MKSIADDLESIAKVGSTASGIAAVVGITYKVWEWSKKKEAREKAELINKLLQEAFEEEKKSIPDLKLAFPPVFIVNPGSEDKPEPTVTVSQEYLTIQSHSAEAVMSPSGDCVAYKGEIVQARNILSMYSTTRIKAGGSWLSSVKASSDDAISVTLNYIMLELNKCLQYKGGAYVREGVHLQILVKFLQRIQRNTAKLGGAKNRKTTIEKCNHAIQKAAQHLEAASKNASASEKLGVIKTEVKEIALQGLRLTIGLLQPDKTLIKYLDIVNEVALASPEDTLVPSLGERVKFIGLDKKLPFYRQIKKIAATMDENSHDISAPMSDDEITQEIKQHQAYFIEAYEPGVTGEIKEKLNLPNLARVMFQTPGELKDSEGSRSLEKADVAQISERLEQVAALLNCISCLNNVNILAREVAYYARLRGEFGLYSDKSNKILFDALKGMQEKAAEYYQQCVSLIKHIRFFNSAFGGDEENGSLLEIYDRLARCIETEFTSKRLATKISEVQSVSAASLKEQMDSKIEVLKNLMRKFNEQCGLDLSPEAIAAFGNNVLDEFTPAQSEPRVAGVGGASFLKRASPSSRMSDHKQVVKELKEAKGSNMALQEKVQSLETKLQSKEQELQAAQLTITSLREGEAAQQIEIERLRNEIQQLNAALEARNDALRNLLTHVRSNIKILNQMWKEMGSMLKQLEENPERYLRSLDLDRVDELRANVRAIVINKANLEALDQNWERIIRGQPLHPKNDQIHTSIPQLIARFGTLQQKVNENFESSNLSDKAMQGLEILKQEFTM